MKKISSCTKQSCVIFLRTGLVGEIGRHSINLPNFFYLLGAALALASASCTASSSIGSAVVTQVDGVPCFGIPDNPENRDGLPLSTVIVTKKSAPGATTRPENVWFSWVEPRGKSIVLKPQGCIRYGVLPAPAHQEMLIPLQPHTVYSVTLDAAPENSNLQGYRREFCIIPDATKKLRVQVVQWDEKASRWQYELCAPGAK